MVFVAETPCCSVEDHIKRPSERCLVGSSGLAGWARFGLSLSTALICHFIHSFCQIQKNGARLYDFIVFLDHIWVVFLIGLGGFWAGKRQTNLETQS